MNEYEQALTMILKLEDTVAELLEALEESLESHCGLCKRLNPQHKDCDWCYEVNDWQETIRKAKGD